MNKQESTGGSTGRSNGGFVRIPVTGFIASAIVAPGLLFLGDPSYQPKQASLPDKVVMEAPVWTESQEQSENDIISKLNSSNRQVRRAAANYVLETQQGSLSLIAKAILKELDSQTLLPQASENPREVIDRVKSQESHLAEEVQVKLRDQSQKNQKNLVVEKKQPVVAKVVSQPNISVSPIQKQPVNIAALVTQLKNCDSFGNCTTATELLKHKSRSKDALIQALLHPNLKIRSLSRLLLARMNSSDKNTPLFHNYAEALSDSVIPDAPQASLVTPQQGELSPVLEGTRWKGIDSEGQKLVFEFLGDGVLSYSSSSGSFSNAYWELHDSELTISINSGFAVYKGTVSGSSMSGTAFNQSGARWSWQFEMQ